MKTAILNAGGGAWAFEEHAQNLSRALEIEISATPADFNYVLGWEGDADPSGQSFISLDSMRLATDKRLLAEVFADCAPHIWKNQRCGAARIAIYCCSTYESSCEPSRM